MNSFLNAVSEIESCKLTENGAQSYSSSLSALVDLFSLGGAYRTRSESDTKNLFIQAFNEDKELATKCLFYLRDVRGGQGERKFFRTNLPILLDNVTSEQREKLCSLVAEYGRWDDLLTVYTKYTEAKNVILRSFMYEVEALREGREDLTIMAKWMPSINTSSKDSVKLAKMIAKDLHMTHKEYRQTLSKLRAQIDVVERKMSANKWEDINLGGLPSQARVLYKTALYKHLPEKMASYIRAVEKGEANINTATLYPYQIFEKVYNQQVEHPEYYETLWKNLPNYVKGDQKAIVVADTSGSMYGTPICIALSLALYFAERNVGPFANKFISFSTKPKLQSIPEGNLSYKIASMQDAECEWFMNTDIDKVFKLILDAAKRSDVKPEDVPSTIYIVSDMEFDECVKGNSTNFEFAKKKFAEAGIKLPQIVFWNVRARNDTLPVRQSEKGVTLVSGCSPSVFKNVVEGTTPRDYMLQVLNSKRYEPVGEAFK